MIRSRHLNWALRQSDEQTNQNPLLVGYTWFVNDGGPEDLKPDLKAQEWSLVVIARDTSYVSQVYVNSSPRMASQRGTGPIPYSAGPQFLRLGAGNIAEQHWQGQLDEVRRIPRRSPTRRCLS